MTSAQKFGEGEVRLCKNYKPSTVE